MPDTLGLFLIAALALNLTPGPDMLYAAANGMNGGVRAGVLAAVGIGAGCLVHTALAAAGVSALIAASPAAFEALRWAGVACLAWIGIAMLRAPAALDLDVRAAGHTPLPLATVFWRGAATNVLNPKVALFFLAFLPQFVDPGFSPAAPQIVLFGVLVTVTGTLVNAAVGMGGGAARAMLTRRPRLAALPQRVSGVVLIALAARFAVEGRA